MKFLHKGEVIEYDKSKLTDSIIKAFKASGNVVVDDLVKDIVDDVVIRLKSTGVQSAELDVVLDSVEDVLIAKRLHAVTRQFIKTRYQEQLQKAIQTPSGVKKIFKKYLDKSSKDITENANISYSLQGLNHAIIRSVTESQWLELFYSGKISEAYHDGYIHIHDLDNLCVYCVGWDIQDVLLRGFGGVPGKTESAPAKHFRTALGQAVNFIFTLQNESAGAQAFSNFDTYLAPFIHFDKLTYKEVKQAMQEFIFNMNVATRQGSQSPFSNITLDLVVPKHMKSQPIIIGGEYQKECFGDFQKEMDMFNKAFFEVMSEGDAKGRIFTFPIPTINVDKHFDWENPNHKIIWDVTAKYGIAYFCNFINSDMDPSESRSMCCRLKLSLKELHRRGGGLFGSGSLTGSIGVVTLSLPMMAVEANGSIDKFFTLLAKYMDIAKESLEIKRKILEELTDQGLYPYSKSYLENIKKRDGKYWGNHFSTIGLIGAYEAAKMLDIDYTSEEGKKFGEQVLLFMNKQVLTFQAETGNFYNLEATPAEGASYKLAVKARKKYPDAVVSGKKDVFFTNSTMLPVDYSVDLFKVLEHQDNLQSLYTGGTVIHTYLGEKITAEQAKALIKKVFTNYKLPYLSITPTFSVCPIHGYTQGEHPICPKCLEEKTSLEERIKVLKGKLK